MDPHTLPRSRRALLAASLGGLAALAAQALGRPAPARAEGEYVQVGGEYTTATSVTKIVNNTNSAIALWAANESGLGGVGVYGSSGVAEGVFGASSSGVGVFGSSAGPAGMAARNTSPDPAIGIYATVGSGTGILGYAGNPYANVTVQPKTGVYGYATQDSGARGVWGYSTSGRGVYGQATGGQGVRGYATTGYGGYFSCGTNGRALKAAGRVDFTTSGTATIASGAKTKKVTPGIDLTSSSRVLVTLMANPGGSTVVQRVGVDTIANTFTVFLTANATANTKFAWFVIG